ncbi:MAG TPA: addiction module protein [Tepidiformaceae bacterium]|nr:addiction module protein [Tepidiformaceae bacterium]
MPNLHTVLRDALALSPEDRELLMVELGTADDPDDGYDDAWGKEIERRLTELHEGRAELLDWEASEQSIFGN